MANKKVAEKKEDEKKDVILDNILDFFLTKNYGKYLAFFVFLGALLRFLLVKNISFLGDEMVHGPHAINMWGSGLISTILESPTWFYLTDIAHKIFGVTIFSTRSLSFVFGTLLIVLVYILAKEVFNKKVGLLAAALLAISTYHIRYTLIEMDHPLIFCVLLGAYLFIRYFKEENKEHLYTAALVLGTGVLIKTITAFFLPVFGIFYFIFKKEKKLMENLKPLYIFVFLIFLFVVPIITHNVILYQQKGVVDTYVAQYFNINREVHSGQLGYDKGFNIMQAFWGTRDTVKGAFLKLDPLIFILGVLGLIFVWKKHKSKENAFIAALCLFGYAVLIVSNLLTTHYANFIPFLCIYAAFFLVSITDKEKIKKHQTKILAGAWIVIFLANMFFIPFNLWPHLTSQTANAPMREYVIDEIPESALVVVDARIYRGRIAWLFNDRHYLESNYLPEILNSRGNTSLAPTTTYFIECAKDDCGWGTVTEGPLNDTSEQIVALFEQNAELVAEFKGGGGYDEETNVPHFKVYRTQIDLPVGITSAVDQTHMWFYYPVRYEPKEQSWDYYVPEGFMQNLFWRISWIIIYISILVGVIMPLILFYVILKRPKNF